MSAQDSKDIIQRGYEAFSAGDMETVMNLFDDDMEQFGRLAEKGLAVKLNRLIAEGDTVVAITEVSAGGESGEDADVFTLRDGKTVRAEIHGDTALLERVYGKKQLAAG